MAFNDSSLPWPSARSVYSMVGSMDMHMDLHTAYSPSILRIVAIPVLLYLVSHFYGLYRRLKHIPGPFFARLTNLQRVWWVKTGRAHEYHTQMHATYGSVVQFGPHMVSVSDPRAIQTIYPSRPGFPKSDFYRTQKPYTRNKGAMPAVFNTQDEDLHKRLRGPIAGLYSMTNVVKFEPLVDQTLAVLLKQLDDRFLNNDMPFDLGNWLQYFAFDSMGTLTFSRRYGFLEQGRDVHGILGEIWAFMKRVAPMGQIPWFDELWNKNAFITLFKKPTGFGVLKVVDSFISQRLASWQVSGDANEKEEKDMLSQFLNIQKSNPDVLPWAPRAWTFSNIMAGSDSTANVMRTIMRNLMVHPETMARLHSELLETERKTGLSRPFPSWEEVRELPYLDACLLEALRLHPPFCLNFERVVPDGGVTVCDTFLPAGTVVGMSPYVTNRDQGTFGQDADQWRPERWLDLSREDRKRLEQSVLTFGAGRRTCLGKNIAILEIKKLIPTLVLHYEVLPFRPESYRTENAWFFRQWGLQAVIHRRKPEPRSSSGLHIPPSSSTVDVRVIDPGTLLDLRPDMFWQPALPGLTKVTAPTYCFLISTTNNDTNSNSQHILFDLGVRSDWENLPPHVVNMVKSQTTIQNPRNIADILDAEPSLPITRSDIEAIIWSHAHFDHIGDPATFPASTALVVGPGIRDTHWPGYPSNPAAINLDSDIANGRPVQEISFDSKDSPNTLRIGSFDALDYFGNGSFYLLNAPGHSTGHMCGLARVTPSSSCPSSPSTFVFMGGDACHHPGVLRPSRHLPCPGHACQSLISKRAGESGSEAVFRVSPALTTDHGAALRTVEGMKELDASEDVFVVLAHDATLRGRVRFFPERVNAWKEKGWKERTRWLFVGDLEEAVEGEKER